MLAEKYGTANEYRLAFETIRSSMPPKHFEMLQAHFAAEDQTTTWAQLAEIIGYANGAAVNLQYGTLAGRVADQLKIREKPQKPRDFWLHILVEWAEELDPQSGHTAFVMRDEVIEALQQLGILPSG